jgi:hypothetical protein
MTDDIVHRWPECLDTLTDYEIACDDKGRTGASWFRIMVANDGDVHLSMQDWERFPEGSPTPFPTLRVRTLAGGGNNIRTRQALLNLAEAIYLDNTENNR